MAPRPRDLSDRYLSSVEHALALPGEWVTVRSDFKTLGNARVTADCLAGGYLRVQPREGDREVRIKGKRYIATAAPVQTDVKQLPGGRFELRIRRFP